MGNGGRRFGTGFFLKLTITNHGAACHFATGDPDLGLQHDQNILPRGSFTERQAKPPDKLSLAWKRDLYEIRDKEARKRAAVR